MFWFLNEIKSMVVSCQLECQFTERSGFLSFGFDLFRRWIVVFLSVSFLWDLFLCVGKRWLHEFFEQSFLAQLPMVAKQPILCVFWRFNFFRLTILFCENQFFLFPVHCFYVQRQSSERTVFQEKISWGGRVYRGGFYRSVQPIWHIWFSYDFQSTILLRQESREHSNGFR